MALDWSVIIYFLGLAVMWGSMQQEVKSLRRDIERLEEKMMKHNNIVERLAVVEVSTKSAHHRIDNFTGEE
jgi:cell division protein FtsL